MLLNWWTRGKLIGALAPNQAHLPAAAADPPALPASRPFGRLTRTRRYSASPAFALLVSTGVSATSLRDLRLLWVQTPVLRFPKTEVACNQGATVQRGGPCRCWSDSFGSVDSRQPLVENESRRRNWLSGMRDGQKQTTQRLRRKLSLISVIEKNAAGTGGSKSCVFSGRQRATPGLTFTTCSAPKAPLRSQTRSKTSSSRVSSS